MILTGNRPTIRLNIALILMFVVLIVGTASLIGVVSFRNGLKAIDEVAERMMDSIQSRVSEGFDAFLALPHAINRLNADAFHSGQLDIRDFPRIRQRFLSQIQAFDSVETCAFGSEAGEFISAGKRDSGTFDSALADKKQDTHYRVYLLDETGNPGKMINMVENYHPQPQPWYQAGLGATGPAWSPVYVWASKANIGISAVLSVRDKSGTVVCVQQSALSLTHIEEFLQTFRKGKPGQVFVMERSGFMIASSMPGVVVRKNSAGHEKPVNRIQAIESDSPLIRDTAMYIKAHVTDFEKIVESRRMRIKLDGKIHFLSVAPYRDNRGLDWIICVVIPESDLFGPEQTNLFTTLPETIRMRLDMAEPHPIIQGNAGQIRQVVTSLMANAIESIGNHAGEIVVTVGVRTSAEMAHTRFHPQDWTPDAMRYVCISVRNTGSGMDADTVEKIFDPFFSTRFTGRGLGLSVSLGIV
ncbi:MAG: ATP-binding protein, partial [Desulfatirhabdiaceae bacterium]